VKLLITGINGFVGTNLVKAFRDNYTLYGIDIVPDVQDGVVSINSWSDLNLAPNADVVIHLAGKAHDTKNTTAEQEYFDINVGLTKQIFDYFLLSKAKKFIFFSSIKAVADSVEEDELTEETIPAPLTPYGRSKLEAERYILSQPVPSDKKVYVLRPCMIHGPGNKGNLNLLYTLVKKGIPYPLGAFENKRSFLSINNLVFILEHLLKTDNSTFDIRHSIFDIPSGIYHLADDEPLATNQLIGLMASSLNKRERIWNINPKLISTFARLGDKINLPLNSERLKKLTESYVVSNTKIKKALEIESMPVTAVEGIRETLEAFSANS
jgi:nucleoside-diphosphate-sugar epimerase